MRSLLCDSMKGNSIMKLNNNTKKGALALGIVLLIFILIAFVIPFPRNGLFWTGFVFGIIGILGSALIIVVAFIKGRDARSRFYGFPIARVGVIYLVVQMILSFIAMGLAWVPVVPAWPFIIVSLLLLAAAALGTIATDITREEIVRQDVQIKRDVSKMRELQSLGNSLVRQCDDVAAKAELQKLSDALRFSDSVSSNATFESETELKQLMEELQNAMLDGDTSGISGLCKQAQNVLAERNRICKLNK